MTTPSSSGAFESCQLLASFHAMYHAILISSPDTNIPTYTTRSNSNICVCDTPPNVLTGFGEEQSTPNRVRLHAPLSIFGVMIFSGRLAEPFNIYWMYASHPLSKSMLIDMNHFSLTQPDILVVIACDILCAFAANTKRPRATSFHSQTP
jgi:hypothetical protein